MRKLVALALAVMMMLTCVPFAMAEEADGENVVTIAMGTSPQSGYPLERRHHRRMG